MRGVFISPAKATSPFKAWRPRVEWVRSKTEGQRPAPVSINQSHYSRIRTSPGARSHCSSSLALFAQDASSFARLAGCLGPGSQKNVKGEGAFPDSTEDPLLAPNMAPKPRNFPSLGWQRRKTTTTLGPRTEAGKPPLAPHPPPTTVLPESWRSSSRCKGEGRQTSSPRLYLRVV